MREALAAAGLRVEVDERQEKIGFKIREAQLQKILYMLVTGDREVAERTVSVRSRSGGDQGARTVDELIRQAQAEIAAEARARGGRGWDPLAGCGRTCTDPDRPGSDDLVVLGGFYRIRSQSAA